MNSKTKIIVLHMKEIIYTVIFATLGILILCLLSDTSINSIRISNLSETVTAMYPLLQPSLENLADQICKSQSLDHLTLSSDSPYTSQLLLNTIRDALKKAAATN